MGKFSFIRLTRNSWKTNHYNLKVFNSKASRTREQIYFYSEFSVNDIRLYILTDKSPPLISQLNWSPYCYNALPRMWESATLHYVRVIQLLFLAVPFCQIVLICETLCISRSYSENLWILKRLQGYKVLLYRVDIFQFKRRRWKKNSWNIKSVREFTRYWQKHEFMRVKTSK